jgi:hypothetical protein
LIAASAVAFYALDMCRVFLAAVALSALAACGGSSPNTPAQRPPEPVTATFSGTTRQSAQGACGGDSHDFTAAEGDVSVRLVETSDPSGALSVQVCAGGVDNRDCTINQQRITAGQSLTGARKGVATQNLKLLPHNCVFGGPFDPAVGITYRISVTHMR